MRPKRAASPCGRAMIDRVRAAAPLLFERSSSASARLLLGYAVNPAAAAKQVPKFEGYHPAVGIGAPQGFGGLRVLRNPIGGGDDGAVREIEVHVRSAVDLLAIGERRARLFGNRQPFEAAALRIRFRLQDPAVLRHDGKSRIGGI